jgi:hypothetical protein
MSILQLRKQHVDGEPEVIAERFSADAYTELKELKKDLRRDYPDEKNVKIWITPKPPDRKPDGSRNVSKQLII